MQTPTINRNSIISVHYFHFIQDVIMLVCTVLTATRHAPAIVKTARVTSRMEHVLIVNLDGLECIVSQVRWQIFFFQIFIVPYFQLNLNTLLQQYFNLKIPCFCITECEDRWYGVNCTKQCIGHCRDNTPCNHVTGQCDKGCDTGWKGYMCEKGNYLRLNFTIFNSHSNDMVK